MKAEILLIDDDKMINFIHRKMIDNHLDNSNIEVFENGPDALEYISAKAGNRFLILLDINMPEMNGWQFLETCTEKGFDNDIDVIILTSSIDRLDKEKANNFARVKGFISKPLSREHFEEYEQLFS